MRGRIRDMGTGDFLIFFNFYFFSIGTVFVSSSQSREESEMANNNTRGAVTGAGVNVRRTDGLASGTRRRERMRGECPTKRRSGRRGITSVGAVQDFAKVRTSFLRPVAPVVAC